MTMEWADLLQRSATTTPVVVVDGARGALGVVRGLGSLGIPWSP